GSLASAYWQGDWQLDIQTWALFGGWAYRLGRPAAPTSLTAVPGNRQITLTWDASAGASSYNVYRAFNSGGPYTAIARNISLKPLVDTAVVSGSTYYYVITASGVGGESGPSNEASATPTGPPPGPPPPPTGLVAVPGSRQVTLTWKASAGAA